VGYIYLGIAGLTAVFWLIGYIVHLRFGRFVLEKTQDAKSLKEAAEFARGYRSANFKSVTDAITKLGGRGRRSIELRQAIQRNGSAFRSHTAAEIYVLCDRGAGMAELIGDFPGAESSLIEQCRCRLSQRMRGDALEAGASEALFEPLLHVVWIAQCAGRRREDQVKRADTSVRRVKNLAIFQHVDTPARQFHRSHRCRCLGTADLGDAMIQIKGIPCESAPSP
jgi:hypothetical protein